MREREEIRRPFLEAGTEPSPAQARRRLCRARARSRQVFVSAVMLGNRSTCGVHSACSPTPSTAQSCAALTPKLPSIHGWTGRPMCGGLRQRAPVVVGACHHFRRQTRETHEAVRAQGDDRRHAACRRRRQRRQQDPIIRDIVALGLAQQVQQQGRLAAPFSPTMNRPRGPIASAAACRNMPPSRRERFIASSRTARIRALRALGFRGGVVTVTELVSRATP